MTLETILDHLRHRLPAQGPIKDFIHHNTLHGFQHLPFEDAVLEAGAFYDAHAYMPLKFYEDAYAQGRITDDALHDARLYFADRLTTITLRQRVRPTRLDELGGDWDLQINPILFRLLAGFLDQGISLWTFPQTDLTFFECLRKLTSDSAFSIASFVNKGRFRAWLKQHPETVVMTLLSQLISDEAQHEAYITETLMAHRGWSGMVNVIEQRPEALLKPRRIRLVELLALKLILESEFIKHHKTSIVNPIVERQIGTESEIWHRAFETTYYGESLQKIQAHALSRNADTASPIDVQAVFCIDDRECSFRRHLEAVDPQVETFATAGFFGIDFFFQSLNDAIPKQSCPAPMKPKHLVKEQPARAQTNEFQRQKIASQRTAISLQRWHDASGSMLMGFFAANTLGHISFLRLIASFFKPAALKSLLSKRIEVATELTLHCQDDSPTQDPIQQGFTHHEMVERVFSVLTSMGLTQNFAPIVAMIAHGSSSANNPHFAAYDCGACSGKPGAPNARAFAAMANLPEVRAHLAKRGMDIPTSTRFVGAYHDTCTDLITFFDTENLSDQQQIVFERFLQSIKQTQELNSQERCQKFAVVKTHISPKDAVREVAHRASALFEPRPELGHATNTLCIVGPRSTTKGLFMDRRAFMNSYDPFHDDDGRILDQILSAVIPVCGGINLEYYFSRVDSGVYGCGTKLSHNVCALVGVYNGVDDDLRTGLPVQMTEIHDPIRLLTIVEQKHDIVEKVVRGNAAVHEWVKNNWVKMACLDPVSREFSWL